MDYFSSLYREVPNDQLVSLLLSFCLVGKFVSPVCAQRRMDSRETSPVQFHLLYLTDEGQVGELSDSGQRKPTFTKSMVRHTCQGKGLKTWTESSGTATIRYK